jgi:hypothetical protein
MEQAIRASGRQNQSKIRQISDPMALTRGSIIRQSPRQSPAGEYSMNQGLTHAGWLSCGSCQMSEK